MMMEVSVIQLVERVTPVSAAPVFRL